MQLHSVGLFYYLLGNLCPYLRSQLKSIQLIAVAKAPTIVKYGGDAVLGTFMDDLKTLEEVNHVFTSLGLGSGVDMGISHP